MKQNPNLLNFRLANDNDIKKKYIFSFDLYKKVN